MILVDIITLVMVILSGLAILIGIGAYISGKKLYAAHFPVLKFLLVLSLLFSGSSAQESYDDGDDDFVLEDEKPIVSPDAIRDINKINEGVANLVNNYLEDEIWRAEAYYFFVWRYWT